MSIRPGVTTDHEPTLLDLVDELTRPRNVANWQGTQIVRRTDPPLLDWLREAVASNIGGGGSGKSGRERVPLDLGALELYGAIDERVRAWLTDLGARPGKDVTPTQSLRTWYVLWNANPANARLERQFKSVLKGWVRSIEEVLDPPRRIDLGGSEPVPCPECGAQWVLNGHVRLDGDPDPDDSAITRALAVYEVKGALEESFASCAVCGTRWEGVMALRALRTAIDEAEQAAAQRTSEVTS